MDLFLVRHAKATERGGIPDPYRPLTSKGRADALALGKAMRHAGVEVETIITSPLVRAVETAELVAVGLHYEEGLEVAAELSPSHDARAVIEDVLVAHAAMKSVALVGHEPLLGMLLRVLVGGHAPGLRKSVAVRLTWANPEAPARFEWVLHPDMEKPSKKIDDVG
jgi:phosphohistidine phosphatase